MCHDESIRSIVNINMDDVLLNGAAALPIKEAETELGFKLTVEIIAPASSHEPLEVNILWRLIDGWIGVKAKPSMTMTPLDWDHPVYIAPVVDDDGNMYNVFVVVEPNQIEVTIAPTEVTLKC